MMCVMDSSTIVTATVDFFVSIVGEKSGYEVNTVCHVIFIAVFVSGVALH